MSLEWYVEKEGSRWTTEPSLVPPEEGTVPSQAPPAPLYYRIYYSTLVNKYMALSITDHGGGWMNMNIGELDSLEEAKARCEEHFLNPIPPVQVHLMIPKKPETSAISPPNTPAELRPPPMRTG